MGRYQLVVGGDIITAFGDQPATGIEVLTLYLETETACGDTTAEPIVLRDGALITIPVTLRKKRQAWGS